MTVDDDGIMMMDRPASTFSFSALVVSMVLTCLVYVSYSRVG